MKMYIKTEDKEMEILSEEHEHEVNGIKIKNDDLYYIDKDGDKVESSELMIINDTNLHNKYRKKVGLLTSDEIISIRKKYKLNQGEYAAVLGMGKITIHRYEKYFIQTEAVDNVLRMSNDPDIMFYMVTTNKDKLSKDKYNETLNIINELREKESHNYIDINNNNNSLKYREHDVKDIAEALINTYNTIIVNSNEEFENDLTPLKLQKLLYYIQGITYKKSNKKAFNENIEAWKHGPVVKEVYDKYKKNGNTPIPPTEKNIEISSGVQNVIEEVCKTYGMLSANELVKLTHSEDPWKKTNEGDIISIDSIKSYFDDVYDIGIKYREI